MQPAANTTTHGSLTVSAGALEVMLTGYLMPLEMFVFYFQLFADSLPSLSLSQLLTTIYLLSTQCVSVWVRTAFPRYLIVQLI